MCRSHNDNDMCEVSDVATYCARRICKILIQKTRSNPNAHSAKGGVEVECVSIYSNREPYMLCVTIFSCMLSGCVSCIRLSGFMYICASKCVSILEDGSV